MARHLAATRDGGMSTFLLEVALDRARTKQRLAAVLFEERTKRGGGDPRRFPQPEMARLLGYSLRQYQRLEDPEDGSLPRWNELEQITSTLGLETSAIFGEAEPEEPVVETTGDLRDLRDHLDAQHDELIRRLDALEELARVAAAQQPA